MNEDPKHQQAQELNNKLGVDSDKYLSLASCRTQEITITGSSVQSAAVGSNKILISCDAACYVAAGENPTATDSLPADVCSLVPGVAYPFTIAMGEKIAVIGTSGTLTIVEVS